MYLSLTLFHSVYTAYIVTWVLDYAMLISINFWETYLRFRFQLQFKCDLEQNTIRNLTLASKVNPLKYMVKANQENALSNFCLKVELKSPVPKILVVNE
jgi:hypothetical protein